MATIGSIVATSEPESGGGLPEAASGGEEDRLLLALRRGSSTGRVVDRQAAEALVEATYRRTYRSLARLTGGDVELAADLTQDTYRKAWAALPGFDGRARFSTWIFRIAYTTFLNHARRPRVVVQFPGTSGDDAPDPLDTVADPAPAVDQTLSDRGAHDRLRRAVLALPEDLRFAVTARFWAELPVREIARQQGITTVGVRKRLQRATKLLASQLEEDTP